MSLQIALHFWVCQMLHEISFQIINMYSIGGQNWASELLWYYSKDLLEYIQFRLLSSCNINKTFDLYTSVPLSKLKDKLRELVQLCFIKKNGQRRHKYLVLGRDRSHFVKMHSDSTKNSLKLISSTCSSFWLTTYLLSLVDVFFNSQSAYLWVQSMLFFSPTCSCIRMRQTSYRGFSRKTKRN
jgi:hypothetical protein